MDSESIRREYSALPLDRAQVPLDPQELFCNWLDTAIDSGFLDATAMALATVSAQLEPSVRIVLLKGHDKSGLRFYTDFESRKGTDLDANPIASVMFHWRELDRQVRVTGAVTKLADAAAATYFHSRPVDSQISATASHQSQPIENRQTLEARVAELTSTYVGHKVPKPTRWGGYLLAPQSFEFWQGRQNRLHDRFRYHKTGAQWVIDRLQP